MRLFIHIMVLSFGIWMTSSPAHAGGTSSKADSLESAIYELSSAAEILFEQVSEAELGEDIHAKASRLKRHCTMLHENLLRGTTLSCLRNDVNRIEFFYQDLETYSAEHDLSQVQTQLESVKTALVWVELQVTDLELVYGEPARPVSHWQCESGGYKLLLYHGGYFGRAINQQEAMRRALLACESSPKNLNFCAIDYCVFLVPR